jgi:DNA-binding beta-propeller fold protein YncE
MSVERVAGWLGLGATVVSTIFAGACGGAAGDAPQTPAVPDVAATPGASAAAQSCDRRTTTAGPSRLDSGGIGSTVVLAEWEDRPLAFVADDDDQAVHVVDVDSGKALGQTPIEGHPGAMVMLRDGRLVVTVRDRSKLVVLEPAGAAAQPMTKLCTVATAAEPVALAVSSDDARLVVTSGWGAQLAVYDGAGIAAQMVIDLDREPRGVALSDDGHTAFVAHAVGGRATVVDLESKETRSVSTEARHDHEIDELRKLMAERVKPGTVLGADEKGQLREMLADADRRVAEPDMRSGRRTACQGFALAKSSDPRGRILAPQVLVDPGDREQRTVGYGEEHATTELPSVAVIDAELGYPLPPSLSVNQTFMFVRNEGEELCLLPRSAAYDASTHSLLVGCFGSDMVVAYDALAPDPARAEKRRWRVGGGPNGLAVDAEERRAVVWSQFDRTLEVIPLGGPELEAREGDDMRLVRRIELEPSPRQLSVEAALGRTLFHATGDARIARDGRACASCHPDGRDDGLVWATPNGPRRTIMLAGRIAGTGPYSWDGDADVVREHVKNTFVRLNGAGGLRSVELRALVAYLESLPPPPAAAPPGDDPKVRRGAEIFASKSAGCADCHSGPRLTDGKMHDVKTKTRTDRNAEFNTPSLLFLKSRAPYLHDGRYRTLDELLAGLDGSMGHVKHLSNEDMDALEAYLLTL